MSRKFCQECMAFAGKNCELPDHTYMPFIDEKDIVFKTPSLSVEDKKVALGVLLNHVYDNRETHLPHEVIQKREEIILNTFIKLFWG